MKSRTSLFVIGILIAMLAASILTVLVLFMTGSFSAAEVPELEFTVNAVEAKEYDGTPLKATGFSWTSGESNLKEGHRVEGTIYGGQTNCGTSESDLRVTVYDENNLDVTHEYSVKVNNCELTVKPKEITVILQEQKITYSGKCPYLEQYKIFDGLELTPEQLDGEGDGELLPGHKLMISFPGQFENVGDSLPTEFTSENVKIYDPAGNVVTRNYKVGLRVDGFIEIVPRLIRLKAVDTEKYYDGTPIKGKWELVSGSLAEGDFIGDVKFVDEEGAEVSLINADSKRVKVGSFSVYKQDGYDLVPAENYVLEGEEETTGTFTVNKRLVEVVAKNFVKTYDGHAITNLLKEDEKPYTSNLPDPFKLSISTDILNHVDVCDLTYTFADDNISVKNGENDVSNQFIIKQTPGIVKITPLVFQSQLTPPASRQYTGDEIPITAADVLGTAYQEQIMEYVSTHTPAVESSLREKLVTLDGESFRIVCSETVKNAKKYNLGVELTDAAATEKFGGRDNVVFKFSTVEFEVTKRNIGVDYKIGTSVNTVNKIYDGKEADLDYRNLVLDDTALAAKFEVSSANFKYGDSQNHALVRYKRNPVTGHYVIHYVNESGEMVEGFSENFSTACVYEPYTAKVNNVHIIDSATSEDVTQNFNVTAPSVSVTIARKTIYAVTGQSVINYEVDSLDSVDTTAISEDCRSMISFPDLIEGDIVGYEDFSFGTTLSGNTLTLSVGLDTVKNSKGDNVTTCYELENDSIPLITVNLKERSTT